MAQVICSECPTTFDDPTGRRKTCSDRCRQKRSRRLAKARREGGKQSKYGEAKVLADAVRGDVSDAAHEVIKEELRPIVREHVLTQNVLSKIAAMVGMLPKAIARLEQDLESSDEIVAQRAYTLILKYTMGNPSVAPKPVEEQPKGLTVHFNMPRPGDNAEPEVVVTQGHDVAVPRLDAAESDSEEQRVCMECNRQKPASEFIGHSHRCRACDDELRRRVTERFASEA